MNVFAGVLEFPPTTMSQTQCINITVVGDNFLEDNTTITTTFSPRYPLDGSDITNTVTVVDDDGTYT